MDLKEEVRGKVVLIFQPAEEKLPGGARLVCKSGILRELGVEEVYGLHTNPDFSTGEISLKAGALMASTAEFDLVVTGNGGHAAAPHTTVDPIVTAAHLLQQFQRSEERRVGSAGRLQWAG